MAERLKAAVLKTVVPQGTVGSNPTSSAFFDDSLKAMTILQGPARNLMWTLSETPYLTPMTTPWYVYILKCRDGSYYTGTTNNIPKRLERHNAGTGAKYTRSRRPCELVYFEEYPDESLARRREYEIKRFTRAQKQAMVTAIDPDTLSGMLNADSE